MVVSVGHRALIFAVLVAGCDSAPAPPPDCAGNGRSVEAGGVSYCVFATEDDSTIRCPQGFPSRIDLDGGVVCAGRTVGVADLPVAVCDLLPEWACRGASDASAPEAGSVDGGSQSLTDAETFCRAKKEVICQRRAFRGEFGPMGTTAAQDGLDDCISGVPDLCAGAVWPVGCEPTQDAAERCIEALRVNPQDLAGDNPPECRLCA